MTTADPLPAGVSVQPGRWHGLDVFYGRHRLGWAFHCRDGAWVAEESGGDYLDADYPTLAAAARALLAALGVEVTG